MRLLCFFLPVLLHALPADRDGDGWPDAEERAKGFDPASARSHPPAPRYAAVDLGPVEAHGLPVALSASGHHVLTDRGERWSWQAGWCSLSVPEGATAQFDVIRADGAVLGRVVYPVPGNMVGELWCWDAAGVSHPVPGTRYGGQPPSDSQADPWLFRPLRWLRGDDFLVQGTPLSPGPLASDVLVASIAGVPTASRRVCTGDVPADESGGRWVRPFSEPTGLFPWRLEGCGRSVTLEDYSEPLAFSDDGSLVTRHLGRLYWHDTLAGEPVPIAGDAFRLALTTDDAGAPVAVELGGASRVWSLDNPGPCDRLADLVDNEEPWTELNAVAVDDQGVILALGLRILPGRLRRDAEGLPIKQWLPSSGGEWRIVLLVPMRLRCDHDRAVDDTGLRARFPMDETGATPASRPLRIWINDDHDAGDLTEDPDSDLPGANLPVPPNFRHGSVGGMADLVDWFPVCLRLGRAAADLPPFRVRLVASGEIPLNAVETGLPVARAAQYLQRDFGAGHGPGLDQPLALASKSKPGPGGLALSAAFSRTLSGPRLLGEGEATLLVEGRAPGDALMWVCLVRADAPADRPPVESDILLRAPLRVKVAPVEDFYRQWDARDTRLSPSGEPSALPDRCCPGPWLVFTHGFNVDGRMGRAWGAEIFKRFYQAGSRARFIANRWFGDQGSANYAMAVECAPAAAMRLADQVLQLERVNAGRPWVLLGHSLGTYVTLLAGRDRLPGRVDLRKLVLVDAALPSESVDVLASARLADYPGGDAQPAGSLLLPLSGPWRTQSPWNWPAAQAPAWASLFPSDDLRSTCAWKGRFATGPAILNLYSRTEDVLMPAPADPGRWPGLIAAADHGAWIYQETHKGRWPVIAVNARRAQAGWALSVSSARRASVLSSADPAQRDALLRKSPLFSEFRLGAILTSAAIGPRSPGSRAVTIRVNATAGWGSRASVPSDLSWTVRDELLAHAIPALSNPAGSVPLAGVENCRMDGAEAIDPPCGELRPFPLGWPRGVEVAEHLAAPARVWRHSDWKNIAFPYVHPVFARIGKSAGLTRVAEAR